MKTIRDFELKGKYVFIRADLNVPQDKKTGKIKDDTRIKEVLPTIKYALEKGAKVIVASHLGRPDGEVKKEYSLINVGEHLSCLLGKDVLFSDDCISDANKKLKDELHEGGIILLENLRFHKEEEKNDPDFAKQLAKGIDIYINDAFGTMHRKHASTYGMATCVKNAGIGFLVEKELKYLGGLLESPKKPFVVILGGAKVSDKISVISSFLERANKIIIGGAMSYTFLKAKGINIGKSLVEEDRVAGMGNILERAREKKVKILLPVDHIAVKSVESTDAPITTAGEEIPADYMGVDIGPKTRALFEKELVSAKTVFFNGPMGIFEDERFKQGTFAIITKLHDIDAVKVVGGGDSVSAVNKFKLADGFTHISTGGGASLEFLEGKELPGIGILKKF